jgi:hypothetical protein
MKEMFECEDCECTWIAEKISKCPRCGSIYTSTVEDD